MKKRDNHFIKQIESIIICLALMSISIILFKFLPMEKFGNNILFDASLHVTITIFVLYFIWIFIGHKKLGKYFLSFSIVVVLFMSIYRIVVKKHDIIGVSLGVLISLLSIYLSNKIVRKLST